MIALQGLSNSTAHIMVTVEGNTTNTALSSGTPAVMNVGTNAVTQNFQRFTSTTDAEITYVGAKDIYVTILASINYDKQGGGSDDYNFYFYKKQPGGSYSQLPGAVAKIGSVGGNDYSNLNLTYATTFTSGSSLTIYIENPSSNDDMRVTDLQFVVKE